MEVVIRLSKVEKVIIKLCAVALDEVTLYHYESLSQNTMLFEWCFLH